MNGGWLAAIAGFISGQYDFFCIKVKLFLQLYVLGYEQQKLVKKVFYWIFLEEIGKFVVILQPELK